MFILSAMNRLEHIAEQINSQKSPPVHMWKPEVHGSIDIEIDVNGNWFHEGDPISREPLVALFASILWCEQGRHYLVTPAEKLSIDVADAPYMIHQAEYADGSWVAVTNTHEQVIIGDQHPVVLRPFGEQWLPYVNIRYDLWARVNRSVYYQWVVEAMEQADNENELWLSSGDYRFRLNPE